MKKPLLFTALSFIAAGSWAFYPKAPATVTDSANYMMVVSSISGGFDAQAFITTVAADGTRQETEVEFKKGSGKKLASNTTDVHKAALATVNEYARTGWHLVSTTPTGLTAGGGTVTSQVIYVLEKR
jgi:hypothetical protein